DAAGARNRRHAAILQSGERISGTAWYFYDVASGPAAPLNLRLSRNYAKYCPIRGHMTLTKVRRERGDADKRKKQIVQVVLTLVPEHGADAVSTQLIADTIGFTQAAVFRHFPTKEAVWSAVMDWLDGQLEEVRQKARAEAPDQGIGVLERIFFGHIALI